MSSMLEKPKKDGKVMSSKEVAKYIDDIAKGMDIDLSKVDYKETRRILNEASSLSVETIGVNEELKDKGLYRFFYL
jgi:hypothetical protein